MGTHPIFESDFDCLTDRLKYGRIQVYERNLAQKAIGNDALFATGSCLAIQKPERHPPGFKTNSSRKGTTIGIQGHSRFRRLQNPYPTWWTQEASTKGSPWVNQFTKVSSCNSLADFNLLPKSVSVATAVPSVFSTPTGLVKTLPTSTSKLSLWTHNTMPSETTQNTNGLPLVSKSTENSVVLLPKERDPVVLARVCDTRL